MKILKKTLLLSATYLMGITMLTGCGSTNGNVEDVIKDAEKMTYAELVEKAKEEVGDGTVLTYGNSSQLEKALTTFTEETGIKITNTKKGDSDIYTELGESFGNGRYVADMVLLQDGAKLQTELLSADYLKNYIPKEHKANLAEDDLNPLAAVYLNKVFMYNNTDYDLTNGDTAKDHALEHYLTNVWQLAGTADDPGHIANTSFKTPSVENVNMNFLVMLTSDEWVAKLTAAYKDFYGKDYVKEEKYDTIAHKWIAEFLTNSQAHSSDGTACAELAKGKGGSMALVNLNKNKDLKDTGVGKESKDNLTYPAMEEGDNLKGFGGFCYKMYAMVASNAKYPYAACAIINYILSKEGFGKAWGAKDGYYSANSTAEIASTDKPLFWWKEHLVIEDPVYVSEHFRDIYSYVQQYEKK